MDSKKREEIINFLRMFVETKYNMIIETVEEGVAVPTNGFSRAQMEGVKAMLKVINLDFTKAWTQDNVQEEVISVLNTTIKIVDTVFGMSKDKSSGCREFKDNTINLLNKMVETINTVFLSLELPYEEAVALLESKMTGGLQKTPMSSYTSEEDEEDTTAKVVDKSYIDNIEYWWKKYNAIVMVTPYDRDVPHVKTPGEFDIKNKSMIVSAAHLVAREMGCDVDAITTNFKTMLHVYLPAEACARNKIMFATITAILSDAAKQHSGSVDELQTIQVAPLQDMDDDTFEALLQQDQPVATEDLLEPIQVILNKKQKSSSGVRKEPIVGGTFPGFSVSDVSDTPTTTINKDGKIVVEDLGCGCQIPDELVKELTIVNNNDDLIKNIPNIEDLSMYVTDNIEEISDKASQCGIGEAVYFVPCASKKIVSEIIPVVAKSKEDAIAKIQMLKSDSASETVGKCYSSADIVKRKEISDVWSSSEESGDDLMSILSKLNK